MREESLTQLLGARLSEKAREKEKLEKNVERREKKKKEAGDSWPWVAGVAQLAREKT